MALPEFKRSKSYAYLNMYYEHSKWERSVTLNSIKMKRVNVVLTGKSPRCVITLSLSVSCVTIPKFFFKIKTMIFTVTEPLCFSGSRSLVSLHM